MSGHEKIERTRKRTGKFWHCEHGPCNTDIDFIEIAVTDAHMVITFSKNRKHVCPPNSSSVRFIWPFTSVHIRFEVNDSKSRFYEIIQIASEIISRWKYRFLTSVSCTNGVNGEIFGHLVVLTRKIKFQLRTHVL